MQETAERWEEQPLGSAHCAVPVAATRTSGTFSMTPDSGANVGRLLQKKIGVRLIKRSGNDGV